MIIWNDSYIYDIYDMYKYIIYVLDLHTIWQELIIWHDSCIYDTYRYIIAVLEFINDMPKNWLYNAIVLYYV